MTHEAGDVISAVSKAAKDSLPVPSLFFFFSIKLRCVQGLINDCHQSKEATAQQRMCSTNG